MSQVLLFHSDVSGAVFSGCRRYRYALWRTWGDGPAFVVIGLNPSTADETEDDPTIRRCKGFARRERCGGLIMLNLFALRATDPREMKAAEDPVGPANDAAIADMVGEGDTVVAAWGVHGDHRGRDAEVAALVPHLQCLGTTKQGHPRHPLYLRSDTPLEPWPGGRG